MTKPNLTVSMDIHGDPQDFTLGGIHQSNLYAKEIEALGPLEAIRVQEFDPLSLSIDDGICTSLPTYIRSLDGEYFRVELSLTRIPKGEPVPHVNEEDIKCTLDGFNRIQTLPTC